MYVEAAEQMAERVIAIGDIHGCAMALRAMLKAIRPQPSDTLITLGDCVDRGPDSRRVIDDLLELRDMCRLIPLLGNHEEMMLNFLDGKPQPDDWLQCGGAETIESYCGAEGELTPVPDEQLEFIRTWGDYFETTTHFFAHGSYEPDGPLTKQHWQTMRWQSLKYGIPEPHLSGRTAVVGHTAQKSGEILDAGHVVCIDTYCWGGGWLTGLDTTSGQVWQVSREGHPRPEKRSVPPAKSA
jgi:Calcineurin-like phosphoesterase